MTHWEKLKQIANAQTIMHQEFLDRNVLRSCLNCEAWDGEETCTLFKARPPARVIVFSCGEQWLGQIPF